MFRGLPASIIFHLGVLGAGYVVWPYTVSTDANYIIVPVELVDVAPETNIAPQIKREEPAEEEEAEEPPNLEDYLENLDALPDEEEVLPEEQFATEEVAPPPPETEEAEPLPDLDAAEPEEEVEKTPEAEAEKPPPDPIRVPDKDDFDDFLNEASNLLNRERTEQRRAPPPAPEPRVLENEQAATRPRKGAGDRTSNTSTVIGIIAAQMNLCWDSVDDLPHPERLNVTLRMALTRDGNLDGDVQLVKPMRAAIGDRAMGVAIERAMRAARKCAPYSLPEGAQDNYEEWKDVVLEIGPGFGK